MKHDVFISHSSQDKPVADAVCSRFENAGIRCWIAPRDIVAGADWGASIVEAIEQCRVFILVFSDNSNNSPQVKRELERAANKGATIIPFRIQDIQPSRNMEYFISSSHWLDALTPPMDQHIDELARQVQSHLGEPGDKPVTPPQVGNAAISGLTAEAEKRQGSPLLIAFAGLMALGFITMAVMLWLQSQEDDPATTAPEAAISSAESPEPARSATASIDLPNLLVLNEDRDPEAIPVSSRIHRQVLNSIQKQFSDMGIAVYDETAVTLDAGFAQDRRRRSDAELIDIARSVPSPPIDIVTIFSIYAYAKPLSYATDVSIRIAGRTLNVQTGRTLDNYEFRSPGTLKAPAQCNRECILEFVGSNSRDVADNLGVALATSLQSKIENAPKPASQNGLPVAYTLNFSGFSPEDVMAIEEYLVQFSGYQSHRPIYQGARRSEIWYEGAITSAKLLRNINRTLEILGIKSVVQFSGNRIDIQKIAG